MQKNDKLFDLKSQENKKKKSKKWFETRLAVRASLVQTQNNILMIGEKGKE